MTIAGTNLDSLPTSGTKNWNVVYDDNIQEIATKLNGPLLITTNNSMGDTDVEDVDAGTAGSPSFTATSPSTSSVTGTGNDSEINSNISELKSKIDELIADRDLIKAQLNELLAALRKTTGCGVLDG